MTYQSFTVSRFIGDDAEHGTTFTVADDDAVNVAHMIAAGFNTMSRNMLGDSVLAVVDKKAGVVQYDGKAEMINRLEPSGPFSQSFTFEPSVDADTILTLFGNGETPTFTAAGKLKTDEPERPEANAAARDEMISFVKRAHAKKVKLQAAVPDGDGRPELDDRWRGMLDVLAKFLVVTGEADKDESHAVARRLCGIDEEMR